MLLSSESKNIVVAMDSFKGSLSSLEAGMAVKKGIQKARIDARVSVCPLADGGEGTVQALTDGMGGVYQEVTVTGPLGNMVEAEYGILKDKKMAVIEMSAAAGITLVPKEKRNPYYTTTYGVGEMILDAIQKGCNKFIIGIGGSATNDGGIGMLQALGFDLYDKDHRSIPFGAEGLEKLAGISNEHMAKELARCEFRIACDVTNPLYGDKGASVVYGPQKGADDNLVKKMDCWMKKYEQLAMQLEPTANAQLSGAGAAGGLGFAFKTFLRATLEPGVKIVLEETNLRQRIQDADLVVTGEGRLDGQTAMGKAPIGVAKLAKEYGKPVIAFAGSVTLEARACNEEGIDAYFSILNELIPLEKAMQKKVASGNLTTTVEQACRLCFLR